MRAGKARRKIARGQPGKIITTMVNFFKLKMIVKITERIILIMTEVAIGA